MSLHSLATSLAVVFLISLILTLWFGYDTEKASGDAGLEYVGPFLIFLVVTVLSGVSCIVVAVIRLAS